MITNMTEERLRHIAAEIAPYVHKTPLWRSSTLSEMTGHNVYLKAELFQKTGSYKPRGMMWALMSLSEEARKKGVITFSAGNAAQGLAYAASILGIKAVVTMPATASLTKARATEEYGAEVILHGTPQECHAHCLALAEQHGYTMVSSYDNVPLMQGHATLGLEVMDELDTIDAVFLGVGGGGMLGGLCMALEAVGNKAAVYGVEPFGAPAMTESLREGHAVSLEKVNTIADGLAAPSAGAACFDVVRDRIAEMLLVSEQQITGAMLLLMQRCKLYAEPAGSAALAGLLAAKDKLPQGSNIVCVVSGGNLDPDRLKALL